MQVAKKINKEISEKYKIIPIKEEKDGILVLTSKMTDESKEYLRFMYNERIILKEISDYNYEYLKDIIFGIEGKCLEEILIFNAIKDNASDIHLEPKNNYVDVRYRINGSLILVHKIDKDEYVTLASKIKLEANMDITEKRRPQDGQIIISYNDVKYDLRISSIPLIYGEKLVIRILYCDKFTYSLEDLSFSKEQIKIIRKIISLNTGFVLVNGPTGAGKSTTLYTILKEIDKNNLNITTLEDPVESIMPNINQMSLNKKMDIDFSTGLRSILRQDPDVIMIGEIRDEETAKMAVRASITGHKVYSTIHCKSPKEVYIRLQNMGIKSYEINDSLIGIISQRLVKTLCNDCKEVDEDKYNNGYALYKKCGCKLCNYSGYSGRQLVSSVCFLEDRNKKKIEELYENDNYLSNENMKQDLKILLLKGKIPYDDYLNFLDGEGMCE